MTHDHHDTVVVEDDRTGSGLGAILGIVAILVLLGAVWYFALGPGAGSSGTTTDNNAPAATEQPPAATDAPPAS